MIKAHWCFLTKCQLCLVVSQQTRCIFNDRYCCFFDSFCLTRKSPFSFCVFLSYRSSRRLPQQCDLRISDPSAAAAELPPAGRWTLPGGVVHPAPDTGMLGGPLLCLEDCEPLPTLCPDRYFPNSPLCRRLLGTSFWISVTCPGVHCLELEPIWDLKVLVWAGGDCLPPIRT